MNFFLEIPLIGCIIYLSYTIYKLKKTQFNAESIQKENNLLKDQLTNREQEHTRREEYLNKTINDLQLSFSKEQSFLKERKEDLDQKEKKTITRYSRSRNSINTRNRQ